MKPDIPAKQPKQNIFRSRKNILIAGVLLLMAVGIILATDSDKQSQPNYDRASAITDESYIEKAAQQDLQILGTQGLQRTFTLSNEENAEFLPEDTQQQADAPLSDSEITTAPSEIGVPVDVEEKKIIKNGFLHFSVTNIENAADTIAKIAKSNGGDIMTKDISSATQSNRFGSITVRVPSENFEQALVALKQIASVVHNESTTSNDVTEQFIDTQARLSAKKTHEGRLLSFFEEAKNVEDLISIEKELSRVRGEIELIEGRLNRLENQTSFSTITIDLKEDAQFGAKNQWRPGQVIKDSANELVTRSQKLIDRMIIISISSLPLIIISLIGLAVAYTLVKKLIITYLNHTDKKNQ